MSSDLPVCLESGLMLHLNLLLWQPSICATLLHLFFILTAPFSLPASVSLICLKLMLVGSELCGFFTNLSPRESPTSALRPHCGSKLNSVCIKYIIQLNLCCEINRVFVKSAVETCMILSASVPAFGCVLLRNISLGLWLISKLWVSWFYMNDMNHC